MHHIGSMKGVERIMQVGELASVLRSSREEVAAQVAAATAKDRENSQLWEQVWPVAPTALGQPLALPSANNHPLWSLTQWSTRHLLLCIVFLLGKVLF